MMLRVRFHEHEYILTQGNLVQGPLATQDQYQSGCPSFAHLFPDGRVLRHGKVLGTVNEIEVLEEISDLVLNDDAGENLFDDVLWESKPQ